MRFNIETNFLPSIGVDLVFNIDSSNPVSCASIIHDTDFKKNTITLAQPIVPLTSSTRYDTLHLTTIITSQEKKIRIGVPCKPIKFIEDYRLANQSSTRALVVQYASPVLETNIRTAFRLPLSKTHTIKAMLTHNQRKYASPVDFKIRDISFTGIGMILQKRRQNIGNSLAGIKRGDILSMDLKLMDKGATKPFGHFPIQTKVVRTNPGYSDTHLLAGLKITAMDREDETLLNRFIHKAQIDELKRLSRR